jgi:hypothetical protein
MTTLSHMNAASAVLSQNICTAEVSNEIKRFPPNLQYYPSIIPVCFFSKLLLAFWLNWLKFSVLPSSGRTLLEAQIILTDRMHTLQISYNTCMVMKHKTSQTSVSFPKVLTWLSTEFGIWGHEQCTTLWFLMGLHCCGMWCYVVWYVGPTYWKNTLKMEAVHFSKMLLCIYQSLLVSPPYCGEEVWVCQWPWELYEP